MKQPPLVTGQFYHICTRSIAGYQIFNGEPEFSRIKQVLWFSRFNDFKIPLSQFLNAGAGKVKNVGESIPRGERLVRIVAYCLMPTHLHLLLQQKLKDGISHFMNRVLNSYTRYFNLRHGRKGPLWEKRFERIWINNDEHLLHETRYIHLNPVTAYLAEDPAEWPYSSYEEYLSPKQVEGSFCEFRDLIFMEPALYEKFVLSDKENQRALAKARKKGRKP